MITMTHETAEARENSVIVLDTIDDQIDHIMNVDYHGAHEGITSARSSICVTSPQHRKITFLDIASARRKIDHYIQECPFFFIK